MKLSSVLTGSISLSYGAHAEGQVGPLGIAIPSNAPSLRSFEAASLGTYDPAYAKYYKLSPFRDKFGNLVTVSTPSGVVGSVFVDPIGNIIVAYAWTATSAQTALAIEILSATNPLFVRGYRDAMQFLQTAQDIAIKEGIDPAKIYLTGFSLGGMLSSYVASQTGVPGISFASSGIPGYKSSSTPVSNFINLLEAGDPIAQYGTDTVEKSSVFREVAHMDHYGISLTMGSTSARTTMDAFSNSISQSTFLQLLLSSQIGNKSLLESYNTLIQSYHQMSLYSEDINNLSYEVGFDPEQPSKP